MRFFGDAIARGPLRDIFGIGGAVQGVSSIASAGIQASAANHAADLQSQAAANSLAFQQNVFNTEQQNEAPYLAEGKTALGELADLTGPGGSLLAPYSGTYNAPAPFQAPTTVDEQNDPGYQFRLQQGEQAIQRGAAAAGGAVTGGTLKALSRYGQDYASNEYANVYNRALGTYDTNFQNNLTNYQTGLNAYYLGQGNTFNRLAALAGIGQTATGQLNSAGSAAAGNYSATALGGANAAGNYLTGGANAIGAGIVGTGNAINNGLTNSAYAPYLQSLAGGGYTPTAGWSNPTGPMNYDEGYGEDLSTGLY